MEDNMQVPVIAIGNSKGIRLPKAILEQLKILDKVEMEVENHQIILKPITETPRNGWGNSFKKMHEAQEDSLLVKDDLSTEAFEWEW
jgi:antitoxin MazE